MTLTEAIHIRKSVRTYTGAPLTDVHRAIIEKAISDASDPFGGLVDMKICDFELRGPQKPGTYGTISGASTYLLTAFGDNENDALSAGFRMEHVILAATQAGISTCWIAGTLKASDFDRKVIWSNGVALRVISPLGYAAGTQSVRARLTRFIAGSSRRKTFESLFFEADPQTPLSSDNKYAAPLALMRLAPSSVNCQPWRAIVSADGSVHFYDAGRKALNSIDMGIGMYHFFIGMGRKGSFVSCAHPDVASWRYVTSFRQ